MDEKIERPELGTTEAAVRSCVNLIALATHTSEEHLAYWLDCYYQLRTAHEKAAKPLDFDDLLVKAEVPDPVIVKLNEIDYKVELAARAVRSLEALIRRGEAAAPSPYAGKAEDDGPTLSSPPTVELNEQLAKGVGPGVDGGIVASAETKGDTVEVKVDGAAIRDAVLGSKKRDAVLGLKKTDAAERGSEGDT